MLALLLSCMTAFAAEGGYAMNDVGGELTLPSGWEMQEWSDWSFKAKSSDGVVMRLYLTPFQVVPDEAAGRAWAAMYQDRLDDEGAADFAAPTVAVQPVKLADREVQAARVGLGFSFEKQATKGVLHAVAFPGEGQVVHVETIAVARNDARARQGLDALVAGFRLDKRPAELGPARVETEAGFAMTAPEGWRAPLQQELGDTLKVSSKVGENELDPARCVSFLRPPAVGEPDLLFACGMPKHLGIVDEYTFADVEAELNALFFGRSEKPVPAAEKVQVGDRIGFLYKPPVAGMPVRLVIAPYDKGIVVLWGLGRQLDDAGLDAAVQAMLPTMEFTGPEGGVPYVSADARMSYYLSYRPTSPLVLGPAAVLGGLVLVVVVALVRRNKRPVIDP